MTASEVGSYYILSETRVEISRAPLTLVSLHFCASGAAGTRNNDKLDGLRQDGVTYGGSTPRFPRIHKLLGCPGKGEDPKIFEKQGTLYGQYSRTRVRIIHLLDDRVNFLAVTPLRFRVEDRQRNYEATSEIISRS